jgi:hypothetical protein
MIRDNYVHFFCIQFVFFLYVVVELFDFFFANDAVCEVFLNCMNKMWQGSKWQVFDGESDEVLCTVKEDKLDLKVFGAFNSQAQNQPDYKTKTNNMSLCMPWSLVILHGKEALAEVCVHKPFVHQTLCFARQEPKW